MRTCSICQSCWSFMLEGVVFPNGPIPRSRLKHMFTFSRFVTQANSKSSEEHVIPCIRLYWPPGSGVPGLPAKWPWKGGPQRGTSLKWRAWGPPTGRSGVGGSAAARHRPCAAAGAAHGLHGSLYLHIVLVNKKALLQLVPYHSSSKSPSPTSCICIELYTIPIY